MRFQVYSRYNMVAATPPEEPWAVISICEKGDFPAIQENHFLQGRLNLQFDDADDLGQGPKSSLFNETMASQVLDFYEAQEKAHTGIIYVHCLMGQSRSAAIAAALEKALTGDDSKYFDNGPYVPNMLVFRKVLDECFARGMVE